MVYIPGKKARAKKQERKTIDISDIEQFKEVANQHGLKIKEEFVDSGMCANMLNLVKEKRKPSIKPEELPF